MVEKSNAPQDVPDDLNPKYIFSLTATVLLMAIAKGEIKPVKLSKRELANRGIGKGGFWVGFDNAKKEWGLKSQP
jgi:hypothetical protein